MEEIKSLSALLFSNLTEILNGDERKEEIVNNIQSKLQESIQGILENIINKLKEDVRKDVDLTGYFKLLDKIKPIGDLFSNIEYLEKLEKLLKNRGYFLPAKNIEELRNLKKKFAETENTKGVSRTQIINKYKGFKKNQKVFKKKRIEILVNYVLVPTIMDTKKYRQIMGFLSEKENFFQITVGGICYHYNKKNDNIERSIKKLLQDYKTLAGDFSESVELTDIASFQEFLKALFFQLEDFSKDENGDSIANNNYNVRDEIDSFINKKIEHIIGTETSGLTESEQDNMRMYIAQRIKEDFDFYNSEFSFDWEMCHTHDGFKALAYYRIYKMLYNYKENDFLNRCGWELVEQCWEDTSIYISPKSNIVSPVYIGKGCVITSACKIEKEVIIGSGTKLISSYNFEPGIMESDDEGLIVVEKKAIIMQNVLICDKARLGESCAIISNNVVRTLIDKNSIFAGNKEKSEILDKQEYINMLKEDEIKCAKI